MHWQAAEPEAEGEVAAEKMKPKPAATLTMDDASEFLPFDTVFSHDDLMSGADGPKVDPDNKEVRNTCTCTQHSTHARRRPRCRCTCTCVARQVRTFK